MTPPVTAFCRRVYDGLPEYLRTADDAQAGDRPLLRYLSTLLDQAGAVEQLLDRVGYIHPEDGGPVDGGVRIGPLDVAGFGAVGVWTVVAGGLGNYRTTTVPGATLALTGGAISVDGLYRFTVTYPAGPTRGVLQVIVDDTLIGEVDQYAVAAGDVAAAFAGQVELEGGDHTLMFRHAGRSNAAVAAPPGSVAVYSVTVASVDDTSDLGDPVTADAGWLVWLAQFVGAARAASSLSTTDLRDAVRFASGGWAAGTKQSIADAARSVLSGTKYALVNDHYTGDPWLLELRVRTSELPGGGTAAVLAAVNAKHAKPAGYALVVTSYEATWATIEADRPLWADWESAPTWTKIEETGAP